MSLPTAFKDYLRAELRKVGERKVAQLKASLLRNDNIDTKALYNSIRYKVVVTNKDFYVQFTWLDGRYRIDYGTLLNRGSSNMGLLNEEGRRRLIAWAKRRIRLNIKPGRSEKAAYRRFVYLMALKWRARRKFPRRRGWANVAFGSRALAELRKLTFNSLEIAFQRWTRLRAKQTQGNINKINRRR